MYIEKQEICPAYIWRINLNCEKGIILLMTQNEEKGVLDYLAVKKLFTFLRGITWKHIMVLFIAWIALILLETEININLMGKYVTIKIFVEL